MSAGQFINYIKGYVDRHSMMYAANGAPTAQNLKENYEAGLQAVTDLARQEYPGDPTAEQRYRSHYIQQAGQQLHAENMTNQANWNILNAALNGPNAIKSEQDLLTNPRLVDAYSAILKTDPSAYKVVNNAINANATGMWDPPATDLTDQAPQQSERHARHGQGPLRKPQPHVILRRHAGRLSSRKPGCLRGHVSIRQRCRGRGSPQRYSPALGTHTAQDQI